MEDRSEKLNLRGTNFRNLRVGSQTAYLTAQDFLDACKDYFEWATDTPLLEEQLFHNKGVIIRSDVTRPRAFTKSGLASFLSIPVSRLQSYKERGGDWEEAMNLVEQAIYNQKFEHAAVGLMNPTIISRDLGLADKQEIGGIGGAAPLSFVINPVATGTFLPPEKEASKTDEA